MDDSKRSLRTIFNEVLEIEDAQERADYLSKACGSDPSLRRKIEGLIDADAAAGGFLAPRDERSDDSATTLVATLTEKSGDCIGHYKLLQKIGEGGCGVVYRPSRRHRSAVASRSRSSSWAWTRSQSSPASRPSVKRSR